jgi:hypothetical protein
VNSTRADVDAVDVPWPYVDAVHGEPEGPTPGALLSGLLALFVGEEVGTDESGFLAMEEGFVRGGAAAGCERSGRHGGESRPSPGAVPVSVPPGGGPQQPQQRLDEAGDMVQHVFNSDEVEGHAPGPSVAVAGVFRAGGQVDVHGHRCVAIHSQSETGRARLARGSEVTKHLSHGS